jgi:hypothetical protein
VTNRMNLRRTAASGLVCLGLGFTGQAAIAAITTYQATDTGVVAGSAYPNSDAKAAQFDLDSAALPGANGSPITFENVAVGTPSPINLGGGVSLSFVTAPEGSYGVDCPVGITNDSLNPDNGFNTTTGGANFLRIATTAAQVPVADAVFTFSTPIVSFGAFITSLDDSTSNAFTYQFNDGSAQSIRFFGPSDAHNAQFLGFTDAAGGITSVTIQDSNPVEYYYAIGMDDIHYATAVPEPASLGILALGGLALVHRRRMAAK